MLPKDLPRKKLLIFGSVVLGLLLILLLSLVKQKQSLQEKMVVDSEINQPVSQIPAPEFQTVSSPKITFKTFETNNASVALPPNVKIHSFANDYSKPSIEALALKLGLTDTKSEGNTTIYYNLNEDDNRGYLRFDSLMGNYQYLSYGNYKLAVSSSSVAQNVRAFLLESNLIDETVDCGITYERTDVEKTTFVECHRDWNKTGLPIVNFAGLLNVPDIKSIKDLEVGMVTDEGETDPAVINVSTGQNGMERPNDFNTVTVAVDDQGYLAGITSNLKTIGSSTDYSLSDLITPENAVAKFRENKTQLSLIVPSDNNIPWITVFPDNTAYDLTASVNDIMLVYIENPFGGQSLTPMYLTRGKGVTSQGYNVEFLQAIPALNNQQQAFYEDGYASEDVAGLMAQVGPTDDPTLKLKTFQPEQQTVTGQMSGESCVPAESQLSPIISLGALGNIGKWTIGAPSPNDTAKTEGVPEYQQFQWYRSEQWYLIPASAQVLPSIDEVVTAFDLLPLTGRGSNIRDMSALQNEWNKNKFCPLRASGGSPTLFGYGKSGEEYEVKVGRSIVYLNTNSDNTIYYEYQPVKFNKPGEGWNILKSDLNQFAQNVGNQLGLTGSEIKKLDFELDLSASKVHSENLYIGLINQNEVDQKVALTVSPNVPVKRFHFYVSKAGNSVRAPELSPLKRTPEMVLEVGAVAQ